MSASSYSQQAGERVEVPEDGEVAADPEIDTQPEEYLSECNEQEPQDFLIRSNFVPIPNMTDEEREIRRRRHQESIRYRTEHYGYFEGFGHPSMNETTPAQNAETTTFMGHRVRVNRQIIPALRCVEAEIERSCAHVPYQPERVTGLRTRNTYHTGEVSNHVYGIAIDIDSHRNTCCRCVARWRDHPLCQIEVDSIFERMAMPECWVHAFERYGFYWLGWDQLQDTMHFEFLGDPDRILREGSMTFGQPSEVGPANGTVQPGLGDRAEDEP
ncbi:MAG: M15 family metallopeptidase [Bradymonadales bacterium]|nr:M15 family metallopeptidase [Bradymonadales bacterium]